MHEDVFIAFSWIIITWEKQTDGSISMCRVHRSGLRRGIPNAEGTIEQHDTPQQPVTGPIQKGRGYPHHHTRGNLEKYRNH